MTPLPPPFAVIFVFVRAKASVCPPILDTLVMHEVVKGGMFYSIGIGLMKNWIVLCESRQDWFEFVVMYKTCMPHVNVMKKVRLKEI